MNQAEAIGHICIWTIACSVALMVPVLTPVVFILCGIWSFKN